MPADVKHRKVFCAWVPGYFRGVPRDAERVVEGLPGHATRYEKRAQIYLGIVTWTA